MEVEEAAERAAEAEEGKTVAVERVVEEDVCEVCDCVACEDDEDGEDDGCVAYEGDEGGEGDGCEACDCEACEGGDCAEEETGRRKELLPCSLHLLVHCLRTRPRHHNNVHRSRSIPSRSYMASHNLRNTKAEAVEKETEVAVEVADTVRNSSSLRRIHRCFPLRSFECRRILRMVKMYSRCRCCTHNRCTRNIVRAIRGDANVEHESADCESASTERGCVHNLCCSGCCPHSKCNLHLVVEMTGLVSQIST